MADDLGQSHQTMDPTLAQFDLNSMDEQGVALLLSVLGFPFYEEQLKDHGITGEILVHLDHEALKDVGIHSVGQRLAILRAVYALKVQQSIPVEAGHYVPPSEDIEEGLLADPAGPPPSQQVLGLLNERDERIRNLEYEVQKLHDTLVTMRDDALRAVNKPPRPNLRSPTSSLFPHPLSNQSTLSRNSSTLKSRTGANGDLSAPSSMLPDSPRSPIDSPRMPPDHPDHHQSGPSTSSLHPPESYNAPLTSGGVLTPTTPTAPGHPDGGPSLSASASSSIHPASASSSSSHPTISTTPATASSSSSRPTTSDRDRQGTSSSGGGGGSSADNPYRSFRVTLEDPCHKVLPAALKKYKINDDWRQYALFICYGNNTERCLAYDEKPLLLFQRLKETNNNPVFMLRHIKDIKSPIAVASAKHAARRDKRAPNIGHGVDKTPTVNRDGALARPTRLHHPPVLLPVGKDKEGAKEKDEVVQQPPASPREAPGYCISIYPYLAEREEEFDVTVGDTFVIISKTKGWWVVHRDLGPSAANDSTPRKSAWVPAGCLLETSVPPLSLADATTLANASTTGNAANVPIEPSYVVSVSTPNIALMDYEKMGSDELDVKKGTPLRILKRYNHWSYAIKDDGQRGWIPSWFCGRVPRAGDGTPTTPTTSTSAPPTATTATVSSFSSSSRERSGSLGANALLPPIRTGGGLMDEVDMSGTTTGSRPTTATVD